MPKTNNFIGKRSGHLFVISRASNDGKGGTQWNCQCDCGKQVVVRGQYLQKARSGYQQKNCSQQCPYRLEVARLDVSGQSFYRLTAMQRVGSNKNGESLWQFQCVCGKKIVRSAVAVRRGQIRSCGCLYRDSCVKHGRSDTAEYRTERTRKWREAHPERAHALSRQSIKTRGLRTPKWLTAEHLAQMSEFYRTANRLTRETGIEYHVDHIYPLQGKSSSGLHVPWNLRVTLAKTNRKKSNKEPEPEDIVRTER